MADYTSLCLHCIGPLQNGICTTCNPEAVTTDPGNAGVCLENCDLTDKRLATVTCLLCTHTFHKKCINDQSVYVCGDCKQIRVHVTEMNGKMDQLLNLVKSQQATIETLIKENKAKAPPLPDCLAGTSIVSDIDPDALINTDILCLRGAELPRLTEKYRQSNKKYNITNIQAGGNDCCSRTDQKPMNEIVDNFKDLITSAKNKSEDVIVGSVLPRGNITPEETERIDTLNANLVTLCTDLDVTFVDNDSYFKFQDGSLNDGYFINDKVHLNPAGSNKLVTRHQLQVKPHRKNNATKPKPTVDNPRGSSNPQPTPRRSTVSPPKSQSRHFQHSFAGNTSSYPTMNEWSTQRPNSGYARRDAFNTPSTPRPSVSAYTRNPKACDYCQEVNHTKRVCRHWLNNRPPPTCHTCGDTGHKAKHHVTPSENAPTRPY